MRNRVKKAEPVEEGAPAWMNTYGDMITLVLTFFVLLFSFSTIDAQKWEKLVSALSGTPYIVAQELDPGVDRPDVIDMGSITESSEATPAPTPTPVPTPTVAPTDYEKLEMSVRFEGLFEKIKNHIRENDLEYLLYVEKQDESILLRLSHSAFFDSGRTKMDDDTKEVLREVCKIIMEYDDLIQSVRIEGHTDNVPISSGKFADNWDLSVLRATSVLRFVTENTDMGDIDLMATGYGESFPIASNDTEEGRAQNRRVDFIIVSNIEN